MNMVWLHQNVLTWKDVLDTLLNKASYKEKNIYIYIISNFRKRKIPIDMYVLITQRENSMEETENYY